MELKSLPKELESLLLEIGFEPTPNKGQYTYDNVNACIYYHTDGTVRYQVCVGNNDVFKLFQVLSKCEEKLLIARNTIELYFAQHNIK